jgi:hypothetical protein
MLLAHALSQLAILGATSIVLRDGRVVQLEHADALLAEMEDCRTFALRAREWWIDIIDETGELFARSVTLWMMKMEALVAAG